MFDTRKLLDQFLGAGGLPTGQAGQGQAPAAQGGGSGQQASGGDLIGRVLNSGALGGAAAGGLVTLLLTNKKSRKMAGSLVKYGALAAVGGLAYKAYSDWQSGKGASATQAEMAREATPPVPPSGSAFEGGTTTQAQSDLSLALLRAMIAAAKADGHIDADEQSRIFGFLDQVDLDTEAKAFVMDELRAPLDVDAVAKAATSQEIAAELYAASLLITDEQNPAEKGYLAMLAARLNLPEDLVAHLHASVAGASEQPQITG